MLVFLANDCVLLNYIKWHVFHGSHIGTLFISVDNRLHFTEKRCFRFVSQRTDFSFRFVPFRFAIYRFFISFRPISFRKVQIFHFVSSHFVSQSTISQYSCDVAHLLMNATQDVSLPGKTQALSFKKTALH